MAAPPWPRARRWRPRRGNAPGCASSRGQMLARGEDGATICAQRPIELGRSSSIRCSSSAPQPHAGVVEPRSRRHGAGAAAGCPRAPSSNARVRQAARSSHGGRVDPEIGTNVRAVRRRRGEADPERAEPRGSQLRWRAAHRFPAPDIDPSRRMSRCGQRGARYASRAGKRVPSREDELAQRTAAIGARGSPAPPRPLSSKARQSTNCHRGRG